MNLMEAKDWKFMRNKDLAELFYFSLKFNNTVLVEDCLQKWKDRYGEINSLFYIKSGTAMFPDPKLQNSLEDKAPEVDLVFTNILKHNDIQWGSFTPNIVKHLESKGLYIHNEFAYYLTIQGIVKENLPLLEFISPYLQLDQPRKIKWLARFVGDKTIKKEIFDYFMREEKFQSCKETLFSLALLWSAAFNNPRFSYYLYTLNQDIFNKVTSKAYDLLEENENIIRINTKTGILGEKDDVINTLLNFKLYYKLQDSTPIKTESKNKLKI